MACSTASSLSKHLEVRSCGRHMVMYFCSCYGRKPLQRCAAQEKVHRNSITVDICHRVALSIFEPPALFRSCSVKNSTSFRIYYSRNMEGGQEVISADLLPLPGCVTPVAYLPVPFPNTS